MDRFVANGTEQDMTASTSFNLPQGSATDDSPAKPFELMGGIINTGTFSELAKRWSSLGRAIGLGRIEERLIGE